MATLDDRPFSKDYSGLINQSVIAGTLIVLCLTGQEIAKRKRRGQKRTEGTGSVESWEFGYLYQGRSWARNASPPLPRWPLQWITDALFFPELKLLELRGLDATVYSRFLRGCAWFALIQSLTTVPILLPIHVHFAGSDVALTSMTRASISALVETPTGISLLWIHLVLLFWITFTWVATLAWIARGAFKYRALIIERAARRRESEAQEETYSQYHPHPQPQYLFSTLPPLDKDKSNRGIQLRTVMVTNIPLSLRSEKELQEYFRYYLSKPTTKPIPVPLPLIDSRPAIANRLYGLFGRVQKRVSQLPAHPDRHHSRDNSLNGEEPAQTELKAAEPPKIERVVLARKMTELASLLERREEVLRKLEAAHIRLARRVLDAVRLEMLQRDGRPTLAQRVFPGRSEGDADVADMDTLVRELGPFVEEFELLDEPRSEASWRVWRRKSRAWVNLPDAGTKRTVWDALHALPRALLDQYQPLTHLSVLFRDKTVPAIDYYTAKLGLLTSLIAENRAKPAQEYDAVSTAFVTFKEPSDAMRACTALAVHPNNILSCQVTMAPSFEDLNWVHIMKSTYKAEFLKDWVVNIGVWAFTIFWVFPLSLFVGLVSIQNIAAYWPSLYNYLNHHPWEEEVIQSFVPTVIASLLTLLIPLILFLIGKKGHKLLTLSQLHDRIMTRYYKFLIVNILVFFCVGTATLQSFLLSFSSHSKNTQSIVDIVANSFPSAGPFYVGWMIFTTGIHSALETALFGLPLLTYLSTRKAAIPRQRAFGIRPRTFNYFYWLPNHLLVFEVILVFSVLNPLVVLFGMAYFLIDSIVIRNQFVHVYAKVYENNGKNILVRIVRYSLDGVILAQVVFLAYMAVLKIKVNVALTGALIIVTVFIKLTLTRVIRSRFERDDLAEANAVCGTGVDDQEQGEQAADDVLEEYGRMQALPSSSRLWRTWKNLSFNYGSHGKRNPRKLANAFSRPHTMLESQADDRLITSQSQQSPTSAAFKTPEVGSPVSPVSAHEKITELAISRPGSPQMLSSSPTNLQRKETVAAWIHAPERRQSLAPPQESLQETSAKPPASRPLVVPHPPVAAWDDEPDPDKPYDNPYYSALIGSSLWLPRNPCCVLDLDDTVDVRMSLTTVEAAGELGSWQAPSILHCPPQSAAVVFPLASSPEEEDPPTSASIAPGSLFPVPAPPRRTLSGSETISLPPRIEARVHDPAEFVRELESSPPRRPSLFSRRSIPRRTSVGTTSSYLAARSASMLDVERNAGSPGSPGAMSTFSLSLGARSRSPHSRQRKPRGMSLDQAVAVRPDISAQAEFAFGTRPEFGVPPPAPPHGVEPSSVSMQEALHAEVMVEEQEVADARVRAEVLEAMQSMRRRPWWGRWLFAQAAE